MKHPKGNTLLIDWFRSRGTEGRAYNGRLLDGVVVVVEIPSGHRLGRLVGRCRSLKEQLHCKKRLAVFPSPAGVSLTKLSLAGNNLFPARETLVSDIPAGDGENDNFLQCNNWSYYIANHTVFTTTVYFSASRWYSSKARCSDWKKSYA
jgi:hypothetical protein